MQYLLLVYVDDKLLGELPPTAFDAEMKQCLQHADEMQSDGKLVSFQQLEAPATARSVRVRGDKTSVLDGPFAETKEVLAGFNLVEAASIEEAVRMALAVSYTHLDVYKRQELDGQDVALLSRGKVPGRAMDRAHVAVGKRLRVELRGFDGIAVEPEADRVLARHGRSPG